ncbi:MAG: hypothetical protein AAFW68_13985 [Pseudomonadota bacterium]
MIVRALTHFFLRSIALGASLSGFAFITDSLPITPAVIGGFVLVCIGAAIFTASMAAASPVSSTRNKGA